MIHTNLAYLSLLHIVHIAYIPLLHIAEFLHIALLHITLYFTTYDKVTTYVGVTEVTSSGNTLTSVISH